MANRATISRKPAKKAKTQRQSNRRKAASKGWFSKLDFLNRVPLSEAFIDRAITVSMVGLVGSGLLALTLYSGVPGYVGTEMAQAVGRAGFTVKRVEIKGLDRMEQLTVYNIALDQHSMAMPLVDLEKVRSRLMRHGWVEDARVSRRLPDTLVVDIIERKPAAIWQNNQKLSLIDAKGVVLERVNANAMPDLPLMIGHNANREALALGALLKEAPALKSVLRSATWIGDRRWDLQFDSGEVLALPEGEKAAAFALTRFARIDGVERLLGRGFVRFDMRDPAKMVVRMSRGAKADSVKTEGSKTATSNEGAQG